MFLPSCRLPVRCLGGLALLLFGLAATPALAQRLPFRTFSSEHGLANSIVLSAAQDADGWLWLGTPDGLSRFDGLRFSTIDKDDGLVDQVIRCVLADPDGRLWVGTDRGLSTRDPDSRRWHTVKAVPAASVRALARTPDGALWVGTYNGLWRLDGDAVLSFSDRDGLPHRRIRSLVTDATGRLWIGTWGGGVARFHDGAFVVYGTAEGLGDLSIRALLDTSEGLLAGTNRGVYRLHNGRFSALSGTGELALGPVTDLLLDRRDRLWLATREQGACRRDDGGLTCFRVRQGLADDSVTSLLEDLEGNLWFGTFGGGLSRLSTELFHSLTSLDGLPHPNVRTIAAGDQVWLGTHGGGVVRLDDSGFELIGPAQGLPGTKVLGIFPARDGGHWLATLQGLVKWRHGSLAQIPEALRQLQVNHLLETAGGDLWIATMDGLVLRRADGSVESFGVADGLPDPRINFLLQDGEGGLWIATGDGLARYSGGRFEVWGVGDGLGDGFVEQLVLRPDGSLWAATAGGLSQWLDGRLSTLTSADGLSHDKCTALIEDPQGRLWIGTTRGIDVYDGRDFLPFSTDDGLLSAEVNSRAVSLGPDGEIWFGTVRGAVAFDQRLAARRVSPPRVHLLAVTAGERRLAAAETAVLEHHEMPLVFEYAGISLAYPEAVDYEVQLLGLDGHWQATSARSMTYSAIPAGSYTFRVRARVLGDATSSAPAAFRFTIEPPFWATWRFRLGALSLIVLAVFGLHRGRLRLLERRNVELEREIRLRRQAESEARRYAKELEHRNFNDELTGLANRASFRERVQIAIDQQRHHPDRQFAVLWIDIDRFKLVNDSYGHAFGNRLLRSFGGRLAGLLTGGDSLARLSGDEFALLTEIEVPVDARRTAQGLQQHLAMPLELDGHEIHLTVAIGIAISHRRYRRADEVLQNADTAMSRAKSKGRGQVAVYDPIMHARALEILELENDLRPALDEGQFELFYQPIKELATGRVASFEGLIRWHHPRRGLLAPKDFLPRVEAAGLQGELGKWIIEAAGHQAASWSKAYGGHPPIAVSVNLFHPQVTQPDLAAQLGRLLEAVQLSPGGLHLEITEDVLIEEPDAAIAVLGQVKELDIEIYLDDFGTGYSSLSYLQRFPVDVLKIDRSFVDSMLEDRDRGRIVESILYLARNLGLRVVAEGVETAEQLARLEELGCDYVQGFYIARPMPGREASELIAGQHALSAG